MEILIGIGVLVVIYAIHRAGGVSAIKSGAQSVIDKVRSVKDEL